VLMIGRGSSSLWLATLTNRFDDLSIVAAIICFSSALTSKGKGTFRMEIHRSSARRILIALAMASSIVFFLTQVFGKSAQHPVTVGAMVVETTPSSQYVLDLRLVADTVNSLRRIHTDSMDAEIPAPAKSLLTTLKHQLRDLIANWLRFEKRQVSTQQLQARAIVDLSNLGLIDNEEGCVIVDPDYFDRGYDYGDIESIRVTRPHDCFELIAVTTTLGICCGADTSLYLFKYEQGEWKLILADEKNEYDSIIEGRRLFEFGVSWPDENEDLFVVTASVNPWCTSNWQSITYRVLRCGPQPYEPMVLLSRAQTIYLGAEDPPYRLEVGDSSFRLRFYGDKYSDFVSKGGEGDAEDENIRELVRCRVEGNAVITEK
jgi:hypothetical protein